MNIILLTIITTACMLVQIFGANLTYSEGSFLSDYCMYQFGHANWWHLGCNLVALWTFRPRPMTVALAYMVSVVAAWLDSCTFGEVTCGMSAMLCAAYARRVVGWGEDFVKPTGLLVLGAVIPGVNWHVHVIAYVSGIYVWLAYYWIKDMWAEHN